MNPLFDNLKKKLQKGSELAKLGADYAMKKAEQSIRTEAIKVDINKLKKQCDKKMNSLAAKTYELYENNKLDNDEIIELCRDIKMLRWKIEEKWNEIDKLKTDEKAPEVREEPKDESCDEETDKEESEK